MYDYTTCYINTTLFYDTILYRLAALHYVYLPSDIGGSGGSPTPLLLFPDPPIILDGRGGGPFCPPHNKLFGFEVWIGGVGIGRCGGPLDGPFDKLPGPPRPFICPWWGEIPDGPRCWGLLRIGPGPPFIGPQLGGPVVGGIPFGKHCECGGIPFGICDS